MTPGKRLTEVSVYNRDGQLIEDVSLFHSFSQGGTPKMFLDSLSLLSLGKYKFDYYDRDSLPQQDTPCTDYWGYWNDIACYYYGLRRENVSLYNQFYNADMKMPSFQKTQKGALSHIHYPTGGYMSVEYEANDAGSLINYSMDTSPYYINNTDNFPIGGLRVKRKTNHAGDTFRSVAYSYTHSRTDSTSSGTLSQMPRYLIIVSFYYVRGFVTDALSEDYGYFYACGPLPMLKAVYHQCKTAGEFSLEERMGCGFGACMGCTLVTAKGPKRVCTEGPVFVKEDLLWQ